MVSNQSCLSPSAKAAIRTWSVMSWLPELSQSLTVLSAPADARRLPPRSQASPKHPPVCAALNVYKRSPE